MELRPQDLLVLFKAAANPGRRWTYAVLGEALELSPSQAHRSVQRAVTAGLAVARGRGDWTPVRPALIEFAVHGVRYVWPAQSGPVKRGVPTSFGVEPLAAKISAGGDEAPVWAHPASLSPIYHSAPQAALVDPALHRLLALQDAIRAGRARERSLATDLLTKELENMDAAG
jgi:hypothetical protein